MFPLWIMGYGLFSLKQLFTTFTIKRSITLRSDIGKEAKCKQTHSFILHFEFSALKQYNGLFAPSLILQQPQSTPLLCVNSNQWTTGICDCFDQCHVCEFVTSENAFKYAS